ncbi:hypothetical protein HMPREF3190_00617 [Umbribacter vaginalis]|nr:hypothetical protein HMPREF3190_00617 [Coriobacteriales bacterium DNF00809]
MTYTPLLQAILTKSYASSTKDILRLRKTHHTCAYTHNTI